jgi:hypothetical protein
MPKITAGRAKLRVRPDDKKLGELILLISERSQDDPSFGAVKLNKLLFYCDFRSYLTFGNPITGQEYFALKNGPAPRRLLPVTTKLFEKGEFAIQQVEYCGYIQKKPIALRPADVSVFTPQEMNLIDQTIQECRGKNATEISEKSHLFAGWKVAREKETIPYQTALVGFREPTTAEREYGLRLEALSQECLNATNSA